MTSPDSTPTKKNTTLSPSASNFCILCGQDIVVQYRIRLWKSDGDKTDACKQFEKYMDYKIGNKDFKIICRPCHNTVHRALRNKEEKKTKFITTLQKAETYQRTQVQEKRMRKDGDGDEISKRKKLLFEQNASKGKLLSGTSPLVKAAKSGNIVELMNEVKQNYETQFSSWVKREVESEAKTLCSKSNTNSNFKLKSPMDASKLSYQEQKTEFVTKAPFSSNVIFSLATNSRISRNLKKTEEKLLPGIMNSVGTLLHLRNERMQANSFINGLILKLGGGNKMCISRFNSLGLSPSYNSMLTKQIELGAEFQQPVKLWSIKLAKECNVVRQTLDVSSDLTTPVAIDLHNLSIADHDEIADASFFDAKASTSNFNYAKDDDFSMTSNAESSDNSIPDCTTYHDLDDYYMKQYAMDYDSHVSDSSSSSEIIIDDVLLDYKFGVVGDNLDVKVHRRHATRDRNNLDFHLFHSIAVRNRVPIPKELIGVPKQIIDTSKLNLTRFLPNENDESLLKEEIGMLISRDLVKYIEDLSWMKPFVTYHLEHEYTEQTSSISEIVNLGIVDKNEASTEGIIDIMNLQHEMVPKSVDKKCILRTFAVGDLLTVERSQNAQLDLQDDDTAEGRLEGLIPALADFHTYGNFLEVIWHLLYNASSSAEIGTLFQARNFLNARSVPGKPMNDVNACEELLLKYSEALLLAAFQELVDGNKINVDDCKDEALNKEKMKNIIDCLVDSFVLPEIPDIPLDDIFKCNVCGKQMKNINTLRQHMKKQHPRKCASNDSNEDHLFNYSRYALTICYVFKDFLDARKHGDGKRIIRLYKFLLLYFRLDGRTKYAYQTLHLLSQIEFLLPPSLAHELMWNRFVNNKGQVDTNVELDRELEHRNKYAKEQIKSFRGKLTEKSIDRVSRSYDEVHKIISNFDNQASVSKPSGRHTVVDWKEDVVELKEQFSANNIFRQIHGRYHFSFPGFPKSYLKTIDMTKLKPWAYKKFKEFNEMNIYQHNQMFICED